MKSSLIGVVTGLLTAATSLAAEQTTMLSSVSLLPTFAQTKPAVDGLNGKLDVLGGAGQSLEHLDGKRRIR